MESSTQKMYNQLWFPGKATISNDGATILKLLDVVHPAAKTLVDIARSQDAEVRSVCVCDAVSLLFELVATQGIISTVRTS